jgi:hypothetical protein
MQSQVQTVKPLPDIEQAESELHKEVHQCIGRIRSMAATDPSSHEAGIRVLRELRKAVFESINQIQHEALLLDAARWIARFCSSESLTLWEWNPRQTGGSEEPDLRISCDGKILISAEATSSERPIGFVDQRMQETLKKLSGMPGERIYFVRTEIMAQRAMTKIQSSGYNIRVVVPEKSP